MKIGYAQAVHGNEEWNAVTEVLQRNQTLMGFRVESFEEKIAALFQKKYGVMVNSGSSANLLAFELLNLPEESEVITPALTFSTTLAPIVQKRLKPVFVDVAQDFYVVNIDQVEEAITEHTRAMMIPSLIGCIPDYPRLRLLCEKHNLTLVEDSCDTLGAKINGLPTGAYTDISTTSFYGSHIITAAGEGGMICVNDGGWDKKARLLRGWGRSSAIKETENIKERLSCQLDEQPYDSKFIFVQIGYNFLPTEISAAFGLEQLKKLGRFSETRSKNFNRLLKFFEQYQEFFNLPGQLPNVSANWLAFPLTIKPEAPFSRAVITTYLEERDIQTRPIFSGNILKQPAFCGISCRVHPGGLPVADFIMKQGFLIGCHHGLEDKHIDRMESVFEDFLKNQKSSR